MLHLETEQRTMEQIVANLNDMGFSATLDQPGTSVDISSDKQHSSTIETATITFTVKLVRVRV